MIAFVAEEVRVTLTGFMQQEMNEDLTSRPELLHQRERKAR